MFSGEFSFPHEITVEKWLSGGPQGGAVYDSPVPITGKWVKGSRMVHSSTGEVVMSSADLYCPADDIEIGPKDKVTLPDESSPPILGTPRIYEASDGSKVQHVVFG